VAEASADAHREGALRQEQPRNGNRDAIDHNLIEGDDLVPDQIRRTGEDRAAGGTWI
jgi:hypothetical protein